MILGIVKKIHKILQDFWTFSQKLEPSMNLEHSQKKNTRDSRFQGIFKDSRTSSDSWALSKKDSGALRDSRAF